MGQPDKTTPRHMALASELLAEIRRERPGIGSRFPTEQELQGRFGVGRHTIREALKILTEQGVIGRRRKTGSVILAHQPLSIFVHTLRDVEGLADFAEATRLKIRKIDLVTDPEAARSDASPTRPASWLRVTGLRIEKASDEVLGSAEILVPASLAPTREDILRGDRPIYQAILGAHPIQIGHVEQEISAAPLSASLARALKEEAGVAALVVRRRYVSSTGQTFEISSNVYPASRYSVRSIIRKRA